MFPLFVLHRIEISKSKFVSPFAFSIRYINIRWMTDKQAPQPQLKQLNNNAVDNNTVDMCTPGRITRAARPRAFLLVSLNFILNGYGCDVVTFTPQNIYAIKYNLFEPITSVVCMRPQ